MEAISSAEVLVHNSRLYYITSKKISLMWPLHFLQWLKREAVENLCILTTVTESKTEIPEQKCSSCYRHGITVFNQIISVSQSYFRCTFGVQTCNGVTDCNFRTEQYLLYWPTVVMQLPVPFGSIIIQSKENYPACCKTTVQ